MRLEPVYRINVFVSPNHVEAIIQGVTEIVPLRYGNYDNVAWYSSEGIEQFRSLEGSNPTLGSENQITKKQSVKIEFSIPRDRNLLERVIKSGIFPFHPWEEPVILLSEELETRKSN